MKKLLLILVLVLLVLCVLGCTEDKINGIVVDKEYIPSETHAVYNWGGRNAGFHLAKTTAEYYLIVDTGAEKVRIKVKKNKYGEYQVGDTYSEKK